MWIFFQRAYSIFNSPSTPDKNGKILFDARQNFKVTANLDLEERGLDKRPPQEAINRRERREKQGEY